jgi:hypothetical protein
MKGQMKEFAKSAIDVFTAPLAAGGRKEAPL